jgi:thioesterase domain-containing protein
VYAIQSRGLDSESELPGDLAEMAADYVQQIRSVQKSGPYHLLGWSFGGVVAHEMACQLQSQDAEVVLLALLDSYPPEPGSTLTEDDVLRELSEELGVEIGLNEDPRTVVASVDAGKIPLGAGRVLGDLTEEAAARVVAVYRNNILLTRTHKPAVFHGDVRYFTAAEEKEADGFVPRDSWREYVSGAIHNTDVPCTHSDMGRPEAMTVVGGEISGRLRQP